MDVGHLHRDPRRADQLSSPQASEAVPGVCVDGQLPVHIVSREMSLFSLSLAESRHTRALRRDPMSLLNQARPHEQPG